MISIRALIQNPWPGPGRGAVTRRVAFLHLAGRGFGCHRLAVGYKTRPYV